MHFLGIDIGGTSIKAGFVSELGIIDQSYRVRIDKSLNQDQMIEKFIKATKRALKAFGKPIKGIGIGCPGSINSETGVCEYSNNLAWYDLSLASLFEKEFHVPCKVTNDANAAMLGEAKFGAGKGTTHSFLLTLGTGVGGGCFLNGKLFAGVQGKGAELGHTLLERNGRPCTCGENGCLESYASVTALVKDTQEAMRKNPNSLMWKYCHGDISKVSGLTSFECAKEGDPSAILVVNNYILFLGEGIRSLANIFRPEKVILGGGLSGQKEYLTDPLNHYIQQHHYGFGGLSAPKYEIVVSVLGNSAGILGAAALAMD